MSEEETPGRESSHCRGLRGAPACCVQGTEKRRLECDQGDGGRSCGAAGRVAFLWVKYRGAGCWTAVAVEAESWIHHGGVRAEAGGQVGGAAGER